VLFLTPVSESRQFSGVKSRSFLPPRTVDAERDAKIAWRQARTLVQVVDTRWRAALESATLDDYEQAACGKSGALLALAAESASRCLTTASSPGRASSSCCATSSIGAACLRIQAFTCIDPRRRIPLFAPAGKDGFYVLVPVPNRPVAQIHQRADAA
jgi:hypothetical protein